jgi:hypothetical protein
MYTIRGHEFFLWVDPNSDPESPRIIAYVTTPIVPPNILVIDVSNTPRLLTAYEAGIPLVSPREVAGQGLGSYAHSISVSSDGREAYVSYWDGGFFTLDTSQIAAAMPFPVITPKGAMSVPYVYPADRLGNTHSATVVPGTRTAVVGDEIYAATDGCPFGWMHTISLGDEQTPPSLQGEFRLDENDPAKCISHSTVPTGTPPSASSRNELGKPVDGTFTMHNQTTIPELVLTTWYGGGLRVVRVDDPADPKEEGFFVPVPVAATATSPYSGAFQTYGTVTPGDPDDDWQIQTWSYPVIRDGLIYFTDVRNGLYIVRPTLDAPFAAEVAATSYAEGNSNLSALL